MNITIKATNVEINDKINQYLTKKLSTIKKFLQDEAIVVVELARTTNHHKKGDVFKAEIRINKEKITKGKTPYAVAQSTDLFSAIDEVKDEIHDMLASAKDKNQVLKKKGAQKVKKLIKG
jgi:ribosomal subunit interface protein